VLKGKAPLIGKKLNKKQMKKLTKIIIIITMTINITACCNTNTQNNNTIDNNTFYMWRYTGTHVASTDGHETLLFHGNFAAGASFDSFPE
jgi:hypothetical protein